METKKEKKDEPLQEELSRIQKELKAPKGQKNSYGNYRYRSCEDILEAVKPLLGKCSVLLSDEIVCIGTQKAKQMIETKNIEVTETIEKEGKKVQVKKLVPKDFYSIVGGERFYIKATAKITDGINEISVSAYARESLDKKGMDSAQITGATSSYARKYALNGLFCIDDTKDADSTNTHGKSDGKTLNETKDVISFDD